MTTALSARVLILNKQWVPIGISDVERAFGLLVTGAAKALDAQFQMFDFESWSDLAAEQGDDIIHTAHRAMKVPRVVILQMYDKLPREKIRFSRNNIYLRDGMRCQYCGIVFPRTRLNLDHVIPKSRGGTTCWTNIVCSCTSCNSIKANRTPAEAGMKLLREPRKPTWSQLHSARPGEKAVPYEDWRPFLDQASAAYWNTELLD